MGECLGWVGRGWLAVWLRGWVGGCLVAWLGVYVAGVMILAQCILLFILWCLRVFSYAYYYSEAKCAVSL